MPGTKSRVLVPHIDRSPSWNIDGEGIEVKRHELIVNTDLLSGRITRIGNGMFECQNRSKEIVSLCWRETGRIFSDTHL